MLDARVRSRRAPLPGGVRTSSAACSSADGRRVALARAEGALEVVDLATGDRSADGPGRAAARGRATPSARPRRRGPRGRVALRVADCGCGSSTPSTRPGGCANPGRAGSWTSLAFAAGREPARRDDGRGRVDPRPDRDRRRRRAPSAPTPARRSSATSTRRASALFSRRGRPARRALRRRRDASRRSPSSTSKASSASRGATTARASRPGRRSACCASSTRPTLDITLEIPALDTEERRADPLLRRRNGGRGLRRVEPARLVDPARRRTRRAARAPDASRRERVPVPLRRRVLAGRAAHRHRRLGRVGPRLQRRDAAGRSRCSRPRGRSRRSRSRPTAAPSSRSAARTT